MAVQVPISYPTNTVGLEKSIQLLKQSQSATDQLRGATTKLGTDTASAGAKVSSTLEGMNQRLVQLRGQINNTSSANSKQLEKLSTEYKNLQAEIDKTNKKLFEQQSAIKSNSDSWQTMFNSVRLFLTAGIVKEVADIALGMASLRGNIEGVSTAFNRLPNAELLLQRLRRATHNTTDDIQLMQQALRAQNYKIPLENLGTLLEFAATKAQQTGQEVNHLIDYIVSGIGLRSIKRLDDLGFTANRVKNALGGVSLQAASMQKVMEAVTSLMNEDMQKTGGYIVTAATNVEELKKNWTALGQTIAKGFDTSAFARFLRDAVKGVDLLVQAGGDPALARTFLLQEQAAAAAAKEVDKFVDSKVKSLKTDEEQKKAIENEIKRTKELVKSREDLVKSLEGKKIDENFRNSIFGFGAAQVNKRIDEEIKSIQQRNLQTQNFIDILKKYKVVREEVQAVEEDEDVVKKRIEEAQKIIESEFNKQQAIRLEAIKTEIEIEKLAGAYEKLADIKSLNIDIMHDEKEIVPEILTEWQKFFALFRNELGGGVGKNDTLTPDKLAKRTKQVTLNILQDQLSATLDREAAAYSARIKMQKSYYDDLIELAGDNEKRKKELEKKRDAEIKELEKKREEAETRAARRRIIIQGAVAVAQVFAQYGYTPASLVAAGLMAAETASQLIVLSKAPKGYAKGVIGLRGRGTETSDSIPAMLSKNESVITAQATRDSYKTLHKIQAGKLNDRVMDKILGGNITVVGADDRHTAEKLDELIKITKANRPPDYVERAGMLYRVKDKGSKSKQYIRSKYGFN